MPNCAVINCKNCSKTANRNIKDISYHRFPKNPLIKEKWIDATGRPDWFPTKNSTMCSEHFHDKYFIFKKSGNKYLMDIAVPEKKIMRFQLDVSEKHNTDGVNDTKVELDLYQDENVNRDKQKSSLSKVTSSDVERLQCLLRSKEDTVRRHSAEIKRLREKNRRLTLILNKHGAEIKVSKDDCSSNEDSKSEQEDYDADRSQYDALKEKTDVETRINHLKVNTEICVTEFEKFGQLVIEELKSMSIDNAVVLQKQIEYVIDRFKTSLRKSITKIRRVNKVNKTKSESALKTNSAKKQRLNESTLKLNEIHKENKSQITTIQDSGDAVFSRTINSLAKIGSSDSLPSKEEIIKIESNSAPYVAYCVKPGVAVASSKTNKLPEDDDYVLEIKIEKCEDQSYEGIEQDPLNTG